MSGSGWIGRPVRRREDGRYLRGEATYVADIALPRMAHVAFVRSPHGHAVLGPIATARALTLPGVLGVFTAGDLADRLRPVPPNVVEGATVAPVPHPPLASGRVRYVGEPVAAVVADTPAAAEDALEAVDVEYAPLPVVTDPQRALEGAPPVHDAVPDNVLLRWSRTGGDPDRAFAAAATVVRQTFRIPRVAAAPIEARGAVAAYDPGADLLTVWCSMQDPHRPRHQLSRALGRPEDRIRVIVPDVGGAFGSKGSLPVEIAVLAALAIRLGRPLRWIESRRDNLLGSYQGRGLDAEMEMALDGEGRILAVRARLVADLGAYLFPATPVPSLTTGMLLVGAYAIPHASVEVVGVATNKVPTGPYRGAGRPEAAYLVERMVDLAARQTGIDPVELRRRNAIPADRFPYTTPLGFTYDSGDYTAALDRLCQIIDYERARAEQRRAREAGRLQGVGVALYVERAGSQLWESAAASVEPSGRVVVRIGSNPHGQGHETTFSQIAAEVLRIDPDLITVEHGDSALVPRGVGTFGSRSITVGGSALLLVLEKIRTQAAAIAAHLLEAAPADIEWEDGRLFVRGAPRRSVAFADVAAAAYQPGRLPPGMEMGLQASGIFVLPRPVFPFGAYGAVVEIDPETGQVRLLTVAAVDDAGRIVNPLLAEGQVIGGVIQGLGEAFTEVFVYGEDGQPLSASFTEYALLRAADAPVVHSEFRETPSPINPLGAKGVGEAGTIGVLAAVANAVMDALAPLGIRHLDFPLTPARLWAAIRERRSTGWG
ncbi:MAG: xanthine dehydrogenase family protein molybdopterin-binding subunit [Armatimonadota bacterium]|nr:xanthine dehydrogenase family protein molybdopterin-binding subunit [Armatimonadota bacterium]MDR7504603.1 xanthine dehydrogenase family protein molybdopterin-binding subunit [Armatimonadota bacterium]